MNESADDQSIPSLKLLCTNAILRYVHVSFHGLAKSCTTPQDFANLLDMNRERTKLPNTKGHMPIQLVIMATIPTLSESEYNSRISGRIEGHTRFWKTNQELKFKCDSYVHPELWIEGCFDYNDICDKGCANMCKKINGRTSSRKSELTAKLRHWTIRLDDFANLPFWAEVEVPVEYRQINAK